MNILKRLNITGSLILRVRCPGCTRETRFTATGFTLRFLSHARPRQAVVTSQYSTYQ